MNSIYKALAFLVVAAAVSQATAQTTAVLSTQGTLTSGNIIITGSTATVLYSQQTGTTGVVRGIAPSVLFSSVGFDVTGTNATLRGVLTTSGIITNSATLSGTLIVNGNITSTGTSNLTSLAVTTGTFLTPIISTTSQGVGTFHGMQWGAISGSSDAYLARLFQGALELKAPTDVGSSFRVSSSYNSGANTRYGVILSSAGGSTATGSINLGWAAGDGLTISSVNGGANITSGRFGIVQGTPTARLHIGAGTATASTAPLKFTSGTVTTTGEAGAMEYNGTNLTFVRSGTTRETIFTGVVGTAPTTTNSGVPTVRYGGDTNYLGEPDRWETINISGTSYRLPLYLP